MQQLREIALVAGIPLKPGMTGFAEAVHAVLPKQRTEKGIRAHKIELARSREDERRAAETARLTTAPLKPEALDIVA